MPPKPTRATPTSREDSYAGVQLLVALSLFCVATLGLLAAPVPTGKPGNYPSWWFSRNVIAQKSPTNSTPGWPTNYPTSDDYSLVNQGQLKNTATAAYNELVAQSPTNVWSTPQGTNLAAMITSWNPTNGDNYALINLGQLKHVAQPFYDVLGQIGYNGAYPWSGSGADDYAIANLGQLKNVFAFDVAAGVTAVTSLTATGGIGEVDLSWTVPPHDPVTSFTVQQSIDGGSTWTTVTTLAAYATSYGVTGLDPTQSYKFRVTANNSVGSTTASATTASATSPVPGSAPAGLTGYLTNSATNMYLSWTAVTGATSYSIDREPVGGTWQNGYTNTTSTTFQDSLTNSPYGYRYRVSAFNAGGASAPSATFPLPRYAVVPLGPHAGWGLDYGGATILNNLGTVIYYNFDYPGGVLTYHLYRWKNGTEQELTTADVLYPMVANNGVGLDDSDNVVQATYNATTGYVETSFWGSSTNSGTILSGPTFTQHDLSNHAYTFSATQPFCIDGGTVFGWATFHPYDIPYTSGTPPSTSYVDAYVIDGGTITAGGGTQLGTRTLTVSYDSFGYPIFTQSGDFKYPLGARNGHLITQSITAGGSETFAVDGTTVSDAPFLVNTRGEALLAAAGGVNKLYQPGGTTTLDFNALGLNAHDIIVGGSPVSAPQIIGTIFVDYDLTADPVLAEKDPVSGAYHELFLNALLPDGSSGISTVSAINDSGTIATYEGSLLVPLQIVRETTPGSGDFEPITDNGLDDNAKLPIYTTESGTGLAMTLSSNTLTATLSQNLSGSSTATMTVALQTAGGTYSGTLTETSAGSGVFTNTGSTVTVTLAPTTQTTSNSTVDTLNVLVTDSTLSLSSYAFTLQESTATSNSFSNVPYTTAITLSGTLSTTVINTISLNMTVGDFPFSTTLTETAVNSRLFHDASYTSVTVTNYVSGASGSMNVAITGSFLASTTFTATLNETSSTSLQYSNVQKTSGNVTVSTPATDGQGIFYIQFPGSTATSITLASGSNSVTTTASPVSGHPNLLRTGKLVLIAPGDPFSASGITTLQVAAGANVTLQMYGQTIVDPGSESSAFIGAFYPFSDTNPSAHLNDIQALLTEGLTWSDSSTTTRTSKGLGWTASVTNPSITRADFMAAIPTHSLLYYFGFGASVVKDVPPLTGIKCWEAHGMDWHYDNITPANIQTANTVGGQLVHHKLVFLNACLTGDKSPGSAAPAFASYFNADAYVGWVGPQYSDVDQGCGLQFFTDLAAPNANVGNAIADVNANPVNTSSLSKLSILGDPKTKVNLKSP